MKPGLAYPVKAKHNIKGYAGYIIKKGKLLVANVTHDSIHVHETNRMDSRLYKIYTTEEKLREDFLVGEEVGEYEHIHN